MRATAKRGAMLEEERRGRARERGSEGRGAEARGAERGELGLSIEDETLTCLPIGLTGSGCGVSSSP
jgi:hypothetical protein